MKVLYFEIHNGECVPSTNSISGYRALISGKRIHNIETCFNVSNIAKNGYGWFLGEIKEENEDWTKNRPNLMKSLQDLAFKMSIEHPFKYTNLEKDNHRFVYAYIWIEGKKYTEAHFVDIE